QPQSLRKNLSSRLRRCAVENPDDQSHHQKVRAANVILLDACEVRRRSEIAWRGIPADSLDWKPDPEAMSAIEMVRHVLEGEYLYMLMAKERRTVSEERSPFARRP